LTQRQLIAQFPPRSASVRLALASVRLQPILSACSLVSLFPALSRVSITGLHIVSQTEIACPVGDKERREDSMKNVILYGLDSYPDQLKPERKHRNRISHVIANSARKVIKSRKLNLTSIHFTIDWFCDNGHHLPISGLSCHLKRPFHELSPCRGHGPGTKRSPRSRKGEPFIEYEIGIHRASRANASEMNDRSDSKRWLSVNETETEGSGSSLIWRV
jgi:hypothetical protein